MDQFIGAMSKIKLDLDLAPKYGLMEQGTQENGSTTKRMGRERFTTQMAMSTRETG